MKKFVYMIMVIGTMFIGNNIVSANECDKYACAVCSYGTTENPNHYTYTVSADSDGNLNLDFTTNDPTQVGFTYYYNKNLIAQNFLTEANDGTESLTCPKKIYMSIEGGRNGSTTSLYSKLEQCGSKCNKDGLNNTSENVNNKPIYRNTKTCSYDVSVPGSTSGQKYRVVITSNGTNLSVVTPNGIDYKIGDEIKPFSTDSAACPNYRISCAYNLCGIYSPTNVEQGLSGIDVDTADDLNGVNGEDNISHPTGGTIRLIKKIYKIVKIVIPVLIVLLSIVDFLGVLLRDDEKNYKTAWDKFIKRIIIGMILFIVPVLVSFIINISGIDVEQSFLDIFV